MSDDGNGIIQGFAGSVPVILTPERVKRPKDSKDGKGGGQCPFCPGQESQTPPTLLALPENSKAWKVRVFANLFPITHTSGQAYGVHEVVVESPDHNACLYRMPVADIALVLRAIRSRMARHAENERIKTVLAFRNQGFRGGASLVHPHTQLVGLSWIPPRIAQEAKAFLNRSEEGTCPLCLPPTDPLIIAEEGNLRAFSPKAPRFPREVWLAPVQHEPSYVNLSDEELDDFSSLLKKILTALSNFFTPFEYNLVLHTEPLEDDSGTFHTHLEILPRAEPMAGFEIGTGMMVNSVSSTETVSSLRDVLYS